MPIYIKIGDIPGESNSQTHPDWLEVSSFSWGESNSGATNGGGSGKASFQDMSITMSTGKASPKLFETCASGRRMATVKMELTRVTNDREIVYLRYEMSECMISSYQVSGDGGSPPSDSVSFNFAKMEYSYFPYDPNGLPGQPVVHWWNQRTNRGG